MYTTGYVFSLDGENEHRDFSYGGFEIFLHKNRKFVAWYDCVKECVRFLKAHIGDTWVEVHREQGAGIFRAISIYREKYNASQTAELRFLAS
jgi:hypothetical protein